MTASLKQADIGFQANLYESKNPTRNWLHNVRRSWIIKRLDRFARGEPSFFEVGIGCCVYTEILAKRGQVFAVDINESFVAAANRIPSVEASVSDICLESLPIAADVALCSEVLEHVPDSASALKNIYSSLKPGGYLILTTPNSFSTVELVARLLKFKPIVAFAKFVYGESVDDLGHINRMTRGQLEKQILDAGFEIVEQDNIALYLPAIAEFSGNLGVRLAQFLAKMMAASTWMSHLLWTQCWVLKRPPIHIPDFLRKSSAYLRK